jgi:hypothetical protein
MASINENVDKIAVSGDSRIRRETASINGKTYGIVSRTHMLVTAMLTALEKGTWSPSLKLASHAQRSWYVILK